MSKEGSVAPKERVNIVYRPATGDRQLKQDLLIGAQPEVPAETEFEKIVNEPHCEICKPQRKRDGGKPVRKQSRRRRGNRRGGNKGKPAHCGRAALAFMFFHITENVLPRVQFAQNRYRQRTEKRRKSRRSEKNQQLRFHFQPPLSAALNLSMPRTVEKSL